jgi:hypothetical protein
MHWLASLFVNSNNELQGDEMVSLDFESYVMLLLMLIC